MKTTGKSAVSRFGGEGGFRFTEATMGMAVTASVIARRIKVFSGSDISRPLQPDSDLRERGDHPRLLPGQDCFGMHSGLYLDLLLEDEQRNHRPPCLAGVRTLLRDALSEQDQVPLLAPGEEGLAPQDRKSTRLNSSHGYITY